ncbi:MULTISPECIES: hypothetical protein [Enterobacteriaceae]|uniref:hypothetical protein n=1 Tax=Enterobacteriaceae TaxID=543 RepID=UPI001F44F534|nr:MULTISPECIES: hypothetical protein [Enterobacteriaceae]HAS1942879.1 hypothetical protein [Enterobacter asburiae]HBT0282332.1 hypothetical protein [Klebsiella pneumoniae]HBV7426530.1 hypothetical protein [Citrobacter freundii]MCS5966774.1 hypothetical protein [Klebsiella variicola subsp. variicola]MDA8495824.1 hypothetical protein [Kluyvera georgiana]
MSMLMLVRSLEDLACSCIELNDFFSFRRKYYPETVLETLLGRTLCWLETPAGEDRGEVSRRDLLGALIESASLWQDGMPSGRFIPVFPSEAPSSEAQIEMRSLLARYSQHLMSPWFQDSATGLLIHPDVYDTAQEGI